jgi:hypothetical protein
MSVIIHHGFETHNQAVLVAGASVKTEIRAAMIVPKFAVCWSDSERVEGIYKTN